MEKYEVAYTPLTPLEPPPCVLAQPPPLVEWGATMVNDQSHQQDDVHGPGVRVPLPRAQMDQLVPSTLTPLPPHPPSYLSSNAAQQIPGLNGMLP